MKQLFLKLMTIERSMESNTCKAIIFFLTAVLLQFVFVSELLAARMYRFVDDNGKTVVSSTLPPEVSQKGYEIINEMGVVLESVAPRKTDEQIQQEKIQAKRLEEQRIRRLEQERLDSILINSYTDISDIERARDIEIESKDRDVMLLQQNIRRYTKLLEDAQTRAARDERLGKELSPKLLKEIKMFQQRIAREEREVDKAAEDKEVINDRYNSSIIRFSELKAAERLRQYSRDKKGTMDKHTIYQCIDQTDCDNAWNIALRFASEFSTTELAWANESTIMMRKPRQVEDISLVLTRVNTSQRGAASIVLEVRCFKSQSGDALCGSAEVQDVKDNFVSYLRAGTLNSPS